MKVLVLGATGMAGQAFCKMLLASGHQVLTVARRNADLNLDISIEADLLTALSKEPFDAIVRTA